MRKRQTEKPSENNCQKVAPSTEVSTLLPLETLPETLPAKFTQVEKNLIALGFFTPSSKRIRDDKVKTITYTSTVAGNKIEAKATIAPLAIYGLPVTADLDKYLALQKLVTDRHNRSGKITNPFTFSSSELLSLLGHGDAGKNYRELEEWLYIMAGTTIGSEGAVYLAGKRRFVVDIFHVFDRVVSFGKELEPDVIADRNYIWFSDWQLENINNNYVIPVDLETYRQLRNHIAKTLVPLLQVWLFASRKTGSFEKRYSELCQLLNIRRYEYLSRVKEQLGPSLDELQQHGYLELWNVEAASEEGEYKLILRHGEKFHRDRRGRLPSGAPALAQPRKPSRRKVQLQAHIDNGLLAELTQRGIGESGARKLLSRLPVDRPIRDLLEWGDQEIARDPSRITNPPGFFIRLLEEHSAPPPTFVSSQARQASQEAQNARERAFYEQCGNALEAEESTRQKLEAQIGALPLSHQQALYERAKSDFYGKYPNLLSVARVDSTVHDDAIRSRMRALLLEGWKPGA